MLAAEHKKFKAGTDARASLYITVLWTTVYIELIIGIYLQSGPI